jgi:hypothetical protein
LSQAGTPIQIDPQNTTAPGIIRGNIPYGFWNENMNGIPPGGVYSETIPIKTILDSSTTQKIVSDLIIMRNDNETMPQIPPDSSVAYDTSTTTWTRSELVTFAEKFALRAFHALDWTLKVDNYGVDHTSIAKYYNKITNVVNGLLILIILVIAFLWNFSIVIPRSRLRRIMIMYVIVSLVVNFSTPFIKLIIDGSNILQNSFMTTQDTTTNQTRRIEAKDFFDYSQLQYDQIFGSELNDSPQATDYKAYDITGNITTGEDKGIKIGLNANGSLDNVTTTGTGQGPSSDTSNPVSHSNTNSAGTMAGGFSVTGDASSDKLVLHQAQIKIPINRRLEDLIFNVAMLILTGIGFYLISLLFLFRIVVLWFLIILSPILILLTIMPAMQQYFRYWASIFVRWIAIGPLFALCLGATVFIWKDIGIPLTSLYSSNIHFDQSGNFAIASPGAISPGLNYTKPMMEYIIGLLMMYIPLLLAFWLTRKLACCPSEASKNVFGIRTKLKNPQPERPEPSSSVSSPKEPLAGEVLPNMKLNQTGHTGSGEGLFFTQEEKEEKIRESSLETAPMAIGKEENIDFQKQEGQLQDNAISHADEHTVQTADEEETQKSELGTSRFVESSLYLAEFSTKDLIEKYEGLEQEKQTSTKKEDELNIMAEQITLVNELKHRAHMGDQEAQQMEKTEIDRRFEEEERENIESTSGENQNGHDRKTNVFDGSLSRQTPALTADQEYELPEEEMQGLQAGKKEEDTQRETEEEIMEQTKTTKKTEEEMMTMDSEWEEQAKVSPGNEKDSPSSAKREKSLDIQKKDKKKEENVDEEDSTGKKENPSVHKRDNRIA